MKQIQYQRRQLNQIDTNQGRTKEKYNKNILCNTNIFLTAILAIVLMSRSNSQKRKLKKYTNSSISTNQDNIKCENYTNTENKASVDNDDIVIAQGEDIYQLKGNSTTQNRK